MICKNCNTKKLLKDSYFAVFLMYDSASVQEQSI